MTTEMASIHAEAGGEYWQCVSDLKAAQARIEELEINIDLVRSRIVRYKDDKWRARGRISLEYKGEFNTMDEAIEAAWKDKRQEDQPCY